MRKLFFIVFFTTAVFLVAKAQSSDYSHIDQFAKRPVPQAVSQNMPALVKHLTAIAKNDFEKARALFVWIATSIKYDTEYYFNQASTEPCVSVDCILKNKKSVCAGYSRLFEQMCAVAGIPCFAVEGYSKGFGYVQGKRFTKGDHAWNVIRLGGQWHLLDVTWAAGTVDTKGRFKADFNNKYFLTKPEELVKTHLPLDPIFQLLNSPVPLTVFEKGETAIKDHLKKMPSRLDFNTALVSFNNMPKVEREQRSAIRAFKFNPKNVYDYAFSCLMYADAIARPLRTKNMMELTYLKVLQKARTNYQTAVECFRQIDGDIAKHNMVYCAGQMDKMNYLLGQFKAIASSR